MILKNHIENLKLNLEKVTDKQGKKSVNIVISKKRLWLPCPRKRGYWRFLFGYHWESVNGE